MKIPQLSTAFCGCSLRLGTIVIAWIEIVLQIFFALILGMFVALGSVLIAGSIEKNKMNEDDGSDPWNPTGINQPDSKEKEKLTSILIGVGVVIVICLLVVYLIHFIATVFLLLGAQKNRPGYLLFWLVLSVLSLLYSLGNMIRVEDFIINAVLFVINLYFTWVVYSFYRELKDNPELSIQHATGDVKLRGDNVPHVPTHFVPDAPPAYSFNQKEF